MALNTTPALLQFVAETPDKFTGMSNFIVDNNSQAVFAVLRANGYTFTTNGEAAVIVRSILTGTSAKSKNELAQLAKIPYLNNNENGTGGLKAPIGTATTAGIGDDLVCVVSSLFSFPIACPPVGATPEQLEAERKAAAEAAAKAQRTTYIIIGVGVVILLVAIYFFTKKKPKTT